MFSIVLNYIKLFFNVFGYLINLLRIKEGRVVYCNSNKKRVSKKKIAAKIENINHKIMKIETDAKFHPCYRLHLIRMKMDLKILLINMKTIERIYYTGYVSTFFSAYDGYIIGDNHNISFICNTENNKKYVLDFELSKKKNNKIEINDNAEEVNLIISSSRQINPIACKLNATNIIFDEKEPEKLTNEYLNKVFWFVRDALDECNFKLVKRVNLYIAAKQATSFVCGMAIKDGHPNIHAYEYRKGSYQYELDFEKRKVLKVEDK